MLSIPFVQIIGCFIYSESSILKGYHAYLGKAIGIQYIGNLEENIQIFGLLTQISLLWIPFLPFGYSGYPSNILRENSWSKPKRDRTDYFADNLK